MSKRINLAAMRMVKVSPGKQLLLSNHNNFHFNRYFSIWATFNNTHECLKKIDVWSFENKLRNCARGAFISPLIFFKTFRTSTFYAWSPLQDSWNRCILNKIKVVVVRKTNCLPDHICTIFIAWRDLSLYIVYLTSTDSTSPRRHA